MNDVKALIMSLTPTEKQQFKKKHNSKSDFIMLFDYINKRKACSNSDAIAFLSEKHPAKKKFTSSYLSVVKSYLINRILESLRIQYIHKKNNYEMLSRAMNADILLEKGLYNLAKIELQTSIEKSLDHSFPIENLLLLRRKSILDYFENYRNTNIDSINTLFESRLEKAEQLILEIKFSRILSILSYQYFNGLNDPKLLREFMNEPFMKDESLSTDFATRYLYHWVHAQFQEFNKNYKAALIHFNNSIQIWVENPKYIKAHPRMYLGACFTYFKYVIHNDPFYNLQKGLNVDDLLSMIQKENLGREESEKFTFIFNLFKILSLRAKGKMSDILKIVNPLIQERNLVSKLPDYEQVVFWYYTILVLLKEGQFKKANDYILDILDPLDQKLPSNPVYMSLFLLLHIVLLLETGFKKRLQYLIPKYKDFLKKENRFSMFESHFMNMATQLISSRFQENQEAVYQRFYLRLRESLDNEKRVAQIEYEFFLKWVEDRKNELNN